MTQQKVFHTDSFTKGGQVFAHEWRMRFQNLRLVLILSLVFFIIGCVIGFKMKPVSAHTFLEFYLFTYLPTKLKIALWPHIESVLTFFDALSRALFHSKKKISILHHCVANFKTTYLDEAGRLYQMKSLVFMQTPWVIARANTCFEIIKIGLYSWGIWFGIFFSYLTWKSRKLETNKILKGQSLLSLSQAIRRVRKQGASWLHIAPKLPLLKSAECTHLMIMGASGSGKSNCINGLLDQIRKQGKRALILDTNGTYVDRFYNPARGDIILNPFDERSVTWGLWADAQTPQDFDAFAESLVPEPKGGSNPVWHKNAREILAVTAQKLKETNDCSLRSLVDYAGWKPVSQVREFYKGTAVESLMCAGGRAEETVHSVRMQMTDALKRLAMLPESETPFSIREFINGTNGHNKGWLFISSKVADRATLSPLLRFWVATAIQALLKKDTKNPEHFFFVLDELFSLEGGTVPNLETFLNEARKYGGCGILGLQDLAGLQKIYGHESLRTFFTNCATKILFAIRDPQSAQYVSQALTEIEILEASESLSMGSHHMRDGVNMGMQRRMKPVVSRDDLMSLPNLTAYISMPQNITTKIPYPYLKLKV